MTANSGGLHEHDGRPNIVLGRSANGTYYWRVQVFAIDESAEALDAARIAAEQIEADLHARYPQVDQKQGDR